MDGWSALAGPAGIAAAWLIVRGLTGAAARSKSQPVTTITVEPIAGAEPAQAQQSQLRIRYEGSTAFIVDAGITVFLDGARCGAGTAKKGVDCLVTTTPGPHQVEVALGTGSLGSKRTRYDVVCEAQRLHRIDLAYSRTWGSFAAKIERSSESSALSS